MLTAKEQELAAKMNGNAAPRQELKRPNPQKQEPSTDADTSIALQQAIGDEAGLAQEVVQSAQSQGASLAVKANVAHFTSYAATNAKLSKQRREAYRQLIKATGEATDTIEVEAAEECGFFTSVCESLSLSSLLLSGQSEPVALPSTNGSSKN